MHKDTTDIVSADWLIVWSDAVFANHDRVAKLSRQLWSIKREVFVILTRGFGVLEKAFHIMGKLASGGTKDTA